MLLCVTPTGKSLHPCPLCIVTVGAGSGHQVAVHLRCFAGCSITALDLSRRTLAFAQRKLSAILSAEDFRRIQFRVGDILQLRPDSFQGQQFEMVSTVGVLHHLSRYHLLTFRWQLQQFQAELTCKGGGSGWGLLRLWDPPPPPRLQFQEFRGLGSCRTFFDCF